MTVLCAIPVQIPVHRVRVRVQCLATGGPIHTAVLRLADYWSDSPEEIAEVLGLPIPRVEQLLADLASGGELIEREFVLWVDHARERALPYSALTGVAIKPERNGPLILPADPPTPATLAHMGLDAGLSWDLDLDGYAQVIEIEQMQADIRDRSLPHVLRLPDTQLLITTQDTASEEYDFKLAQHGVTDPQLTAWTRANHDDGLETFIDKAELGATHTTITQLAEIAKHGDWQTIEPHPGVLREHVLEAAERAEHRLAVAAPDLRHIPTWLEQTLTEARERDVEIVLCPSKADLLPKRAGFPFTTTTAPRHFPFTASRPSPHSGALALIADDAQAVLHSDAAACLDRPTQPVRQHMHATRDRAAIAWLLDKLAIKLLCSPAPRRPLSSATIAAMLRQALTDLQTELPAGATAAIHPEDERFATQTLARHTATDTPTAAAHKVAAGIAWERIVMTRIGTLTSDPDRLRLLAERWVPHDARIDLDAILADHAKGVTWTVDAKNATPTADQLGKMQAQIRLLRDHADLHEGRPIIGLIVHRRTQLDPPVQPTEHHNIIRATLQRLPDLLLAKRLPGSGPPLLDDGEAEPLRS